LFIENDKHTKNKLCTKLALFTRLYKDAGQQNIKNPEILFFTSDIKFASQLYVQTSDRLHHLESRV